MSREILIQIGTGETRVAIIDEGKLDDFYIEKVNDQSILGNVYKGRVESILPSINGAFVNIGQEKNGFLYLTDAINPLLEEEINGPKKLLHRILKHKDKTAPRQEASPQPLKEGQEILVQVVKDPFSNKGARLTTHISLAGRFIVYMPFDSHNGVSKKILNMDERQRLKDVLKGFTFTRQGGFIVRTVSCEQGKRELLRDAKFLYKIWQQITKLAENKKAPALIYKEFDLIWKVVRDYLNARVDKVVIDSSEDFIKLKKFVQNLIGKEEIHKIHLYRGTSPLFEAKGVSKELEKIYNPRVLLKSGAYIVIEPTEGLIVVDVNSGRFKTKASPEEAAFMVNMEAAPEIARQLRLRDLGGIIVIDFIDMSREMHKRKVLEALQVALKKDHAKSEVNQISSLGLVEMTRARTGKALESIAFGVCPYCDGRGRVKTS
ncbi:MAG TPA: Rne/Rng family ribonuclease [Candidatus Omnitrophota bacterium]|nr:Rne/Rng family ribonuclease [Candidatus Omnitrophota bacterium]